MPTAKLTRSMLLVCWLLSGLGAANQTQGQSTSTPRLTIAEAVLKVSEERDIPCRAAGVIEATHIEEGKLLQAGQPVVNIDSRLARLDVERLKRELDKTTREESSRVELDYAQRSIEVAQAELVRGKNSNLLTPGSVAQSEIDELRLRVDKAIAEKDKIEFQTVVKKMTTSIRKTELEIGEQKLAQHQITAPMDGMVIEIYKQPGEWVEPSQPVCRMVRLRKLKTEIKVPATMALDNLEEAVVTFEPKLKSLQGREYAAKIKFVIPEANPVNQTVRVLVEIENPDLSLIPGLTGKVNIF